MKKKYISPVTSVMKINTQIHLLSLSSVGDEYSSTDVTYSRRGHGSDWDDED